MPVHFRTTSITDRQWEVLSTLEPSFLFVRKDWQPKGVWAALERKAWIEIRRREKYFLVRLTNAGIEVRDRVMARDARRRSNRLWGHRR